MDAKERAGKSDFFVQPRRLRKMNRNGRKIEKFIPEVAILRAY